MTDEKILRDTNQLTFARIDELVKMFYEAFLQNKNEQALVTLELYRAEIMPYLIKHNKDTTEIEIARSNALNVTKPHTTSRMIRNALTSYFEKLHISASAVGLGLSDSKSKNQLLGGVYLNG